VGLPAGFLPDEAIGKILAGGRVPPASCGTSAKPWTRCASVSMPG
jgi:hypothetical protein